MPDNAADRKDIRRREKAAKQSAVRRAEVTREIMSTAAGREWMWNHLAACHIFATTFVSAAPDQSAFAEGERNAGLRLLADIMLACPDQYIIAMREANVRDTVDERRSSPVDDGRDSGPSDDATDREDGYLYDFDLDGNEVRRDN